jgi:hypothetical protein
VRSAEAFPEGSYATITGVFLHHPQWHGGVVKVIQSPGYDSLRDLFDENYRLVAFEDGHEFAADVYQANIPVSALTAVSVQ